MWNDIINEAVHINQGTLKFQIKPLIHLMVRKTILNKTRRMKIIQGERDTIFKYIYLNRYT